MYDQDAGRAETVSSHAPQVSASFLCYRGLKAEVSRLQYKAGQEEQTQAKLQTDQCRCQTQENKPTPCASLATMPK
jgi:hypothetical protein